MAPGGLNVRVATEGDAGQMDEVHVRTWQAAYRGLVPDQYLELSTNPDRRGRTWSDRRMASPMLARAARFTLAVSRSGCRGAAEDVRLYDNPACHEPAPSAKKP